MRVGLVRSLQPPDILWIHWRVYNSIANTSKGGTLSAFFWCLCQKLSLSPLYFNKTLLHKSSEQSSLVSGPGLNSSPLEGKNPGVLSFSNNLSEQEIDQGTEWGIKPSKALFLCTSRQEPPFAEIINICECFHHKVICLFFL